MTVRIGVNIQRDIGRLRIHHFIALARLDGRWKHTAGALLLLLHRNVFG